MKCKMTPYKVCAAIILGIVAFGFSLSSLDDALTRYEKRNDLPSVYQIENRSPEARLTSEITRPAGDPVARFFQILFILFMLSPPLMVVLLFLIWKELKSRNKMK